MTTTTTVVNQQQLTPYNIYLDHMNLTGDFKHGFCGFCGSCSDCLLAFLCPPCYAFCAAQNVNESFCTALLNCLCWPLCLCCLRGTARGKRNIRGGIIGDFCASWCCPCCTAIQIKREFD